MWIDVPGYVLTVESWQLAYLVNFGLILPLLMYSIAAQMYLMRLEIPIWLSLGAGVGVLFWFTPVLIVPILWLPALQIGLGAPFLAALIFRAPSRLYVSFLRCTPRFRGWGGCRCMSEAVGFGRGLVVSIAGPFFMTA